MLNKKLFQQLLQNYQTYDRMREEAHKISKTVLRQSKQAIFSMHRDDLNEAKKILDGAESLLLNLEKLIKKEPAIIHEGFFNEAAEEFVEAKMFYIFLIEEKVSFEAKIKLSTQNYLGGICDLTGEIVRKSVQLATVGKFKKISLYKEACENILGELIKFDLVGKLRFKFDEAKRNIKKMEEIMYEIKIRER